VRFSVYQLSDQGARPRNEDRMGYCYTSHAGLFAVADGMGGHPEGEVAAQFALKTLAARFQREAQPLLADPPRFLYESFIAAHQQLLRYATGRSMSDTPRTTLVACVIQDGSAWWAHCGDSRLYLQRGERLLTRTRDHSYREIQGTLAVLMPEAEKLGRNVLFTCLGSPGTPVVDNAGPVPLLPGDRVTLCSDGVWAPLGDEAIVRAMQAGPVSQAVRTLVDTALRESGRRSDNVTVLGLEWEGADPAELATAEPLRGAEQADTEPLLVSDNAGPHSDLPGGEGTDAAAPPADAGTGGGPAGAIRRLNDTLRRAVGRKKAS
jgi:serine/threonine protein phosphatase PrpC